MTIRTLFALVLSGVLYIPASWGQSHIVRFNTNIGKMDVMLFDETPAHRDLFLSQIRKGTYKGAEFNRVIKGFVSQGGELDEAILAREAAGADRQRVPNEIATKYCHEKGMLAAGRDDNAEKASYLSQIYLVQGHTYTDTQLDSISAKRGMAISPERREIYRKVGGVPHLDGNYTIFGKIIRGQHVADRINAVRTNTHDKPIKPVVFDLEIIR